MDLSTRSAFQTVCDHAFQGEIAILPALVQAAQDSNFQNEKTDELALKLVRTERQAHSAFGIETFLKRFGLETAEGLSLLRLAEALLRIPDAETASLLMRETLQAGEWKHQPSPWPVALSTRGLGVAARLLGVPGDHSLISRASAPAILRAARLGVRWMGGHFVLADTIERATDKAEKSKGVLYSFDMLGESARSDAQALHYTEQYLHAMRIAGAKVDRSLPLMQRDSISVKLSALDPRYEALRLPKLRTRLLARLTSIALAAKDAGVPVTIDAEESSRLEISLELFAELATRSEFKDYPGIGLAIQAYQTRAMDVIAFVHAVARVRGSTIPVRLVKGAYWDAEIKQAQIMGLPEFPVFTQKAFTDISYLACASALLEAGNRLYPQFGTHNARTIADILTMAESRPFEFQRLFGMGDAIYRALAKTQPETVCRIYAPVGPHRELLAYLIRRLLENGASSSFLHHFSDREVSDASLVRSPLENIPTSPNEAIRHPRDLFQPKRANALGLDLSYRAFRPLLKNFGSIPWEQLTPVAAVSNARKGFDEWANRSVADRAAVIERMAELLETRRDEMLALLIQEGKKTWSDAIGEWREAQDMCRYYAAQARELLYGPITLPGPTAEANRLSLHPRGVFLCISPWNFPLAIFTGQVVAALVTGNSVVAKPAEQTPRIAQTCVRWLVEAGVPENALQLVIGSGESVGAELVADLRIAGVVFTGGTDTARYINRALAAKDGPIIPFIAETGGQNAMIVDSTALLEQTVGHAAISAFGSAGQRCSALRVVYVHESVADAFYDLMVGAMQELAIGDPADLATDIGPVIDEHQQTALQAHITQFTSDAKRWAATPVPENVVGHFVAPHLFEIGHISELPGEVFGPVLHLIRYHDLEDVIAQINGTGYGLTLGIETRVPSRAREITTKAKVGNVYINRVMTGAVVGSQPFGGEGLSGTGPKAGGPHYLLRFLTERTVSENLAAVGGNIDLLAGKPAG